MHCSLLMAQLDDLVGRAIALSAHGGEGDVDALVAGIRSLRPDVEAHAAEVLPHLARLADRLAESTTRAPPDVAREAASFRFGSIKLRPDPPRPSARIAVFVVRDEIRVLAEGCRYILAKQRYEAARRPGDRCDCAARREAAFFSGGPSGPLRLLDSQGVPFAAMDYLWVCEACGSRWCASEAHDDLGAHVTWSPDP